MADVTQPHCYRQRFTASKLGDDSNSDETKTLRLHQRSCRHVFFFLACVVCRSYSDFGQMGHEELFESNGNM